MVEYLGTVNGIITKTELKSLVSFGSNGGDITFHKFKEDNILYLLPNESLKDSVLYSDLTSRNLVNGKNITIKNTVYNIRLLTGGNGNPSNDAGGEWDKFIVTNSLSSQFDTNYFWCQEADSIGGNGYYVTRKGTMYLRMSQTVNVWGGVYTGWLPVLVLSCNLLNSITSQDLGNLALWVNKPYEITGDTYTLTEKIDGEVFRTLPNQANGTPQVLDISSKWNELGYGSHTIEIIATDSDGLSSIVEITFNKIKEITKPIPITSSLKELIDHIGNVDKDIDYLRYKLYDNLTAKGVECSDIDKMSSLIDKIGDIGNIYISDNEVVSIPEQIATVDNNKTLHLLSYKCNAKGSLRVSSELYGYNSNSYFKIEHLSNNIVVNSKKISSLTTAFIYYSYDLDNIKVGDVINLYLYNKSGDTHARKTSIKGDII